MNDESRRKADTIARLGIYISTPQGNSMLPMLIGGRDQIAVVALTKKAVRGDVLLYESHNTQVLHRVVRATESGYLTRGDHCYTLETVPDDMVIGKLSVFWRNGKEIDCQKSRCYRFYSLFWLFIYPLRHFAARVRSALSVLLRRHRV